MGGVAVRVAVCRSERNGICCFQWLLGIRGTFEEGEPAYRHGTFINGFFETWEIPYGERAFGFATTGQTIVNVPDATVIRLYVDDEPFDLASADPPIPAGPRHACGNARTYRRLGESGRAENTRGVAASRVVPRKTCRGYLVPGHGVERSCRARALIRVDRSFRERAQWERRSATGPFVRGQGTDPSVGKRDRSPCPVELHHGQKRDGTTLWDRSHT